MAAAAVVILGILGCIAIGVVSMLGAMMGGSSDDGSDDCTSPVDVAPASMSGAGTRGLSAAQLAHAGTVVTEGRRLGVPTQGIVIALAVASQESHFTIYANDGKGSDITVLQAGVNQSLDLPHEAVGSDHGSVGIFQQQWPWWGNLPDLMDPVKSADKFFAALSKVPAWQTMPVTVAAQRVQRSAYPDAYADDETLARELLAGAGGVAGVQNASYTSEATQDCAGVDTVATGPVAFPLPRSASYVDQHNYGGYGGHWARMHTGTDLSVACGTPVLAATAGTVIIRTDQSWAGRWLVQVSTGIGQLTTWYAHMRAVSAHNGEQVSPGQQIGEVGDLGNATGCHLHFEVHPQGGSIYQDSVNPNPWLAQHVGRPDLTTIQPVDASSGYDWLTVATFNTLGDSHTQPGGNESWMASGTARTAGVVTMLEKYGVDVVGLQEFQRPQYRSFERRVGSVYALWSAPGDTENAIAWRRDRFQLVSARTLSIPYFNGHHRRMPVVRLLDRRTGKTAVFLNVHNPADTHQYHHQGHWRSVAVGLERALVRRLSAAGATRVFVTGDMNDRHDVFCRLTSGALMSSATGPSGGAGCQLPKHPEIDWIFGSRGVAFSDYTWERSRLVRWTTDHPFVVARAHVG
jgi:murein DD-endopeptidase MepM/ murein hydrolase activator NlpD